MIDWNSQTADYAIVALENSRTGGTEVADGRPAFRADQFIGMRSEAEIGKYLDATAAYLPLANSFRMQVNAKSLHPDVPGSDMVAAALRAVAARGYGIILVYTDPVFHGDRPKDDAYWAANVSVLDGRPIELDGEVVSRRNRRALYSWGAASPEYDPVDYLRDGWGAVLDWLDANPEVKAQVRGYELVNEPGRVYTDANNPTEMRAYAEAMVEVWGAHKDRWTSGSNPAPARILVDVAGGGSGRVGALDRVAPGRAESALDLIRGRIGAPLVWSVHTFTDTSLEEFRSPDSHTGLVKLAGDDILITETQFDGDFSSWGRTAARCATSPPATGSRGGRAWRSSPRISMRTAAPTLPRGWGGSCWTRSSAAATISAPAKSRGTARQASAAASGPRSASTPRCSWATRARRSRSPATSPPSPI
ncbi:hypothetical protein [Paracoccus sanguinis]|uniref:Uncharacterized protein n=1 Tax=Paracoccus sanguinis TaxID=1545044 RepID=A0A099GJ01_9RHOB|nr:hypothetical protein [Paracoccus sanguinis]KGJ22497.1 hypothetical protein IX56_07810 [Paracoccus sanguinis]